MQHRIDGKPASVVVKQHVVVVQVAVKHNPIRRTRGQLLQQGGRPHHQPPRKRSIARVAAQMGEPDRAIAALQQVLSIPGTGALEKYMPLTPALLRLDPMFDPLRNDPRFKKLVDSPGSK